MARRNDKRLATDDGSSYKTLLDAARDATAQATGPLEAA